MVFASLSIKKSPSYYQIVTPPSTIIACPVTKDEAGAARKRSAVRNSPGLPIRLIGITPETASRIGPGANATLLAGLKKGPGQIEFTVTPCSPEAAAKYFDSPRSACLLA